MRVLVVSAIASLAAAQATYPNGTYTYSNGTFTCAKPNAAYCAGDSSLTSDIIIRCDENGKGTPGRCEDNLVGQPPFGLNPAQCWQQDKTSGIAACEKNCVVYGSSGSYNGTFTLGSDVCTPYSTAPTTTPTLTSEPTWTDDCDDDDEPVTTETTTSTDKPTTTTTTTTSKPEPTETKTYTHKPTPTETEIEPCTDDDEPETTTYTHTPKPTWTETEPCTDESEMTTTTKTYTHKPWPTWNGTETYTEESTVIETTSCTTEIPLSTGTGGTGTYHHHSTGGHNTTVTTATTPYSSYTATNVPPTPTTSVGYPATTSTGLVTVNGAVGKVASGMFAGLGLLVAALL